MSCMESNSTTIPIRKSTDDGTFSSDDQRHDRPRLPNATTPMWSSVAEIDREEHGVPVSVDENLGPVSQEKRQQLHDVRASAQLPRSTFPHDAGQDLSRFRSHSQSVTV